MLTLIKLLNNTESRNLISVNPDQIYMLIHISALGKGINAFTDVKGEYYASGFHDYDCIVCRYSDSNIANIREHIIYNHKKETEQIKQDGFLKTEDGGCICPVCNHWTDSLFEHTFDRHAWNINSPVKDRNRFLKYAQKIIPDIENFETIHNRPELEAILIDYAKSCIEAEDRAKLSIDCSRISAFGRCSGIVKESDWRMKEYAERLLNSKPRI